MPKVTSKLQFTIPKAIADELGIKPGDEVRVERAGRALRVTPERTAARRKLITARLRAFDEATERHLAMPPRPAAADRGWTREDLYDDRRNRPR
jgi:AbrB family looped-hinge helix DNA binding protein